MGPNWRESLLIPPLITLWHTFGAKDIDDDDNES